MSVYALKTMTPEIAKILEELALLDLDVDPDEHREALADLAAGYASILDGLERLPVGHSMRVRIAAVRAAREGATS